MNNVLLIIILSALFLGLLATISGAIIITADRRIRKARAEAEAWKEIAERSNKRLEALGYREIDL